MKEKELKLDEIEDSYTHTWVSNKKSRDRVIKSPGEEKICQAIEIKARENYDFLAC
jgi:hypothetical protein